jgi:hypothetical protein
MKLDQLQYAVTDAPDDQDHNDSKTSREVPPPKTYAEMYLKVGDKIPIETIHNHHRPSMRLPAKIIGWLEGNSLLLEIPLKAAKTGLVRLNEQVLLRAFNGQNAFAFSATVIKIEQFPFTYLHLSFPKKISALEVRTSIRQQVSIPVTLTIEGMGDVSGHIQDLNMTGACVSTPIPLADESAIRFTLHFDLHGVAFSLKLESHLRSTKTIQEKDGTIHHQSGLEFQNLEPNDRLMLSSLLWKEMQTQSGHNV